ncbi:M56 family metallopeptidase [Aquimarina algiphila]|uniref:M56 family metallopeptidase n=1 Tax=Aquimarina algiphila TaxID=2047982 RepID=UPI00249077A3|nr:M56 family metallopeptidase [Aquimarina algiphila]
METFLIYIFKSSVLLSIFYWVYYLLLRKDTFFTINRHFLLLGVFISILLPFVEFTTIKFIEAPLFYATGTDSSAPSSEVRKSTNWWMIGCMIYSIGVLILFIRFGFQLLSLKRLVDHNQVIKNEEFHYVEVAEEIAPFSFFNLIVYNAALHSSKELDMILKHEKVHVKQYHTIDVLIINLIIIFQWVNPFVWLYKKSLEQNLEFIADREAINQLSSKREYQLTLVRVSSNNYSAITNNFYQSLIKKRIVMLNKQTSQSKKLWKITIILPLLSLFLWSFNTTEIIKIKSGKQSRNGVSKDIISPNAGKKTIQFIIDKNSTKEDLNKVKKILKNDYDVEVKFSSIERNNKDEIINIKIDVASKKSTGNYVLKNDEPIHPIIISYNSKTGSISIGGGSSAGNSEYVWVNSNGKTKGSNQIIQIHSDEDDGHFEMHTDDKRTFAYITGNSKKDPLFIIDDKESTKEKMEKIDSDHIETINVLKGKAAEKKYGSKGKNGVVEIITKKK